MARRCEVTGKKTWVWNTRSHSLRAGKRKYYPNLFWKNVRDPETGLVFRIKVSAKGLKTLKKNGLI